MGNCRAYYDLISSILGVLFSISAFFVFVFKYGNIQAGTWAAFSGLFSGICLLLHILFWTDKLENYYPPEVLIRLEGLGFVVMILGLAVTVWYSFAMIYWHIPVLPVKESLLICAVWSLITSKWGFSLYLSSRRYISILRRSYTPILQSV